MRVVGHRGSPATAPENTAPSFEEAMAAGVWAVELDVRLTADGGALVHHDETTERVCGTGGVIRELTLEVCRRLRARSDLPGSTGAERLLSLDDALSLLRPRATVFAELKGGREEAPELVKAVLGSLERSGGQTGVAVISSSPAVLEEARRADSELELGVVYPALPRFRLDGLVARVRPTWIVSHKIHGRRAWVQEQRERGLRVLAYTVNEREEAEGLREAGVAGVISDCPRRMLGWLRTAESSR